MIEMLKHTPILSLWVILFVTISSLIAVGLIFFNLRADSIEAIERYEETKKLLALKEIQIQDLFNSLSKKDEEIQAHRDLIRALNEQINGSPKTDEVSKILNEATTLTGKLRKMTEIDEKVLGKYSKVSFLNEHYTPPSLAVVPSEYRLNSALVVRTEVLPFLTEMLTAMKSDGLNPKIVSAYRSFGTQSALKRSFYVKYGSGANSFSADQGYSEHQLGTAVDLSTGELAEKFEDFVNTKEYAWLLKNAHKFGFSLSYPEGNSHYIFEPWHWRFIGKELATKLFLENKKFFDITQREIDLYRVKIFDI